MGLNYSELTKLQYRDMQIPNFPPTKWCSHKEKIVLIRMEADVKKIYLKTTSSLNYFMLCST